MKQLSLVLLALFALAATTGCDALDVLKVVSSYTGGGSDLSYDFYANTMRPGSALFPHVMNVGYAYGW